MGVLFKENPDEEYDPWHLPLLTSFLIAASLMAFYAISRWRNFFVSLRVHSKRPPQGGKIKVGTEPHVTIQICTYNEGDVVRETIVRACTVDWPRYQLEVQVLDDSTDKHSIDIIDKTVSHWQERGVKISHKTRPVRIGYKAGSLNYHFKSIQGEFVACLDADHRIEPDFLRRAMAHFFDERGEELRNIGLVQAPWGFYNRDTNWLTMADGMSLDAHHVIEQNSRCASFGGFSFNGTGGIWRTGAIKRGGGWNWDTVTEDLALSYLAYNNGYRFVYARDIPQQLELPANFLAHIQQKHRWSKGFLQVFRCSYWKLFISRKITPLAKWEIFSHITGPVQYPAFAVGFLVYPYIMIHAIDNTLIRLLPLVAVIEPILSAVFTCYAKHSGRGEDKWDIFCARTKRLPVVVLNLALASGISFFQTKAVLEGIFSNNAVFLTTPKKGSSNKVDLAINSDDLVAYFAIFAGVQRMVVLSKIDIYLEPSFLNQLCIALNTFISFALFWVNGSFLKEKYGCKFFQISSLLPDSKRVRRLALFSVIAAFLFFMIRYRATSDMIMAPSTTDLLKMHSVQPAKRGVYFMANDRVLEQTIAFLNSFRKFNPTLPLALVPYDETDCATLVTLADNYEFGVHYVPELFEQLDDLGALYLKGHIERHRCIGYVRKMAIWNGPFEEFLYLDVDSVVLDSVDFAFPLLQHADVLTAQSNSAGMKEWVWEDTIDESGLLTPEQIEYSANLGSILSSKDFGSTQEMVSKAMNDLPAIQPYLGRKNLTGLNDQGILNYLFVTSGKRYSSFHKLAYQWPRIDGVKLEMNGGYIDDGEIEHYMTDDHRIGKNNDGEYPIFFVHWTGDKCDKKYVAWTCDVWHYWRNFHELS